MAIASEVIEKTLKRPLLIEEARREGPSWVVIASGFTGQYALHIDPRDGSLQKMVRV